MSVIERIKQRFEATRISSTTALGVKYLPIDEPEIAELEALQARLERYESAFRKLREWCGAYDHVNADGTSQFQPVDTERASYALLADGIQPGDYYAQITRENMRRVDRILDEIGG